MNDDTTRSTGGIGQRTRLLEDAVAAVEREQDATIGLPAEIEPGRFSFTFMVDAWGSGDFQAQDITFEWDGGRTATWTEDISMHEAISPGSSAPTSGWASWLNSSDLLLAYANEEIGLEGWARITGGAPAPGADDQEETLADPARWVELARRISVVVHGAELPGMTGEQFGE